MRKWLAAGLVLMVMLSFAALPASASSSVNMTVLFKSEALPADAVQIVQEAGATVVATIPELGAVVVNAPLSALEKLNGHKAIQAASPALEVKLAPAQTYVDASLEAMPDLGYAVYYNVYQWDIKQVTHNGASWNLTSGSHNTVVGIIDTGVSQNHPALKGNLLGGRNFTPDGPGGAVVPTDIEDRNGHGSHVAGNIAGKGRILGIGPDLGFRAYRVFSATGGSPTARIVQAMVAAVNDGVDVISMSIGGFDGISGWTYTDPATGEVFKGKDVADHLLYKRAAQFAINHGIVVVAAAGNESIDISHPPTVTAYLNYEYGSQGYNFHGASMEAPGALPGVLTVSATGPDKSLASYSNYGPGAIDIAAPGGDFQRYPAPDYYLDMCLSAYKGTGYVFMAGTSMATPKVSAVAALLIDQAKAAGQKLTPAQVVAKLQQTAVDEGKNGADPFYGHGMLDAYYALGGK
ncbi:MAG TPA: S8 family serine peptidase [Symbiobacteriaceae bacterium]|nr:S8 family serine peptidase [Symbiobacteriaceae bacterium]